MQIDGYSLDAQRSRMKAYADFNDYEIVGEYEDAGKSGKSIEGRSSEAYLAIRFASRSAKPFHSSSMSIFRYIPFISLSWQG